MSFFLSKTSRYTKRAKELGFFNTTYNCQVKLFVATENKKVSQPVDSVKTVEDLQHGAIKKRFKQKPSFVGQNQPFYRPNETWKLKVPWMKI